VIWVDGGLIRQDGSPETVVGAYEVAMSSADRPSLERENGNASKARFVGWDIAAKTEEGEHSVNWDGAVQVRFHVDARQAIRYGHHGVALFNAERQLMWAWAAENVSLEPGLNTLSYDFPFLPLRPGAYTWNVSLYMDHNLLDQWDATPDMIIATPNHQHARDEWNGVLNVPSKFSIVSETGSTDARASS
jgi:hypothetical protein